MLWADQRKREVLPIDQHLEKIITLLEGHQVVICEAGTGAGKSTRIPQAVLLHYSKERILMTQPRRNACRWIGERIASELGTKPGELVAWRLRDAELDYNFEDVRLELLIDQSLANQIRRQKRLPEGIIIIDEAHERSISIDLLLGLIKEKLKDSPKTRVLITSATIDTQKFSEFFDNAPIVSVQGRCFPVSTEIITLTNREHHTQGAARAARSVIDRFLQDRLTIPKEGMEEQIVTKGVVIILLPGKEDITVVKRELEEIAQSFEGNKKIEVFTCHGESTFVEQSKIQKLVSCNTLRFICSTEILRSSVTVPDTIGIIDSLQIKRIVTNSKGVGGLEKILVSKAEAEQAKGRAGRTSPGFYIAVGSYHEFENLVSWPSPAILREPITRVALQIAAVDRSMRDFALIDRPALEKIDSAISRLKLISALTAEEAITEEGKLLLQFPVDPELAVMLLHADKLNVLSETIIIIAALQIGDFFQPIRKDTSIIVDQALLMQIEAVEKLPKACVRPHSAGLWKIDCGHEAFPHENGARWINDCVKRGWAGDSKSDFTVMVRAYRAFQSEGHAFQKRSVPAYKLQQIRDLHFKNWCEARGLNLKRMQLTDEKIQEILEVVRLSRLTLGHPCYQYREFENAALVKAVAAGKVDHIAHNSNAYWQASRATFSGKITHDCQLDFTSACPQDSEFILVGNIRKIHKTSRGEAQYDLLANVAASIQREWLLEIAPALCTEKLLKNYYYDAEKDCVKQTKIEYFNDEHELSRKELVVIDGVEKKRLGNFEYDPKRDEVLETQVIFVGNKELIKRSIVVLSENVLAQWLTNVCYSQLSIVTDIKKLSAFIETTQASNKLVLELNTRAAKNLILYYSREDMFHHFREIIQDKQRFCELTDIQWRQLQLPGQDLDDVKIRFKNYPDEIIVKNKRLKVNYPDNEFPYVELKAADCYEEGLYEFVKEPLLLVDGRQIKINVQFGLVDTFTVTWQEQHADLSRCPDLKSINFFRVQSLTTYQPSAEIRQRLPYFLTADDLTNIGTLKVALKRLNDIVLVLNQLQFVQWSVATQVIDHARQHRTLELLTALQTDSFMTKTDLFSNMADSVSSWFSYFRQPVAQNTSVGLLEYIRQEIRQIESVDAFEEKFHSLGARRA